MLADVARAALARSGRAEELLGRIGAITFVDSVSWPVPDPSRVLAEALGRPDAESVKTLVGGISPVEALADASERIREGSIDAALVCGVECFDVLMRAMKEGRDPGFLTQPEGSEPDRLVGKLGDTSHPVELAAGLIAPVAYYPLFESAVRGAAGRNPAEHQAYLGELWARFAEVAATNSNAWSRDAVSAEEIATPGPANRQVTIPYTKLMNSNIQTNQAACLVVCAAEVAGELGVKPRVHLRATATGSDHAFPSEREALDRSPAIAACAGAALAHSGLAIEDVDHLDIYSCFPSAVQVAAREIGLDPLGDRPLTATGGLAFAGGPGSNYVTHSIAALCENVATEGGHALATAVGWYLTKHGAVVLSAESGGAAWEHFNPQAELDAGPRRDVVPPPTSGTGRIEAYTAICNREGKPEVAIATFLIGDARTVAKADDPASLAAAAERDCLGAEATFLEDGRFKL
jgi:acetyl-CoA C-acetyltransferase